MITQEETARQRLTQITTENKEKIQNKFSWYIDRVVASINKHHQVLLTPLTTPGLTSTVNNHLSSKRTCFIANYIYERAEQSH